MGDGFLMYRDGSDFFIEWADPPSGVSHVFGPMDASTLADTAEFFRHKRMHALADCIVWFASGGKSGCFPRSCRRHVKSGRLRLSPGF